MRLLVPTLSGLLLQACGGGGDGGEPDTGDGDGTPATGEGWCAVSAILEARCESCHSGLTPQGGLSLDADPYGALVEGESQYAARTLVVPGDPYTSFLYLKVTDQQEADEGDAMPPPEGLDAYEAGLVHDWILAGASNLCAEPDSGDVERYHPEGYEEGEVHGLDAKLQVEDCTTCHGEALEGGTSGVSCDGCHDDGWRTDCTFCHGGAENTTGAPPRAIDGTDATPRFLAHTTHVTETIKPAYDCVECHAEPADVLSPGHVFVGDGTPGVAETDFSAGISPEASWDPSLGTCSNLYCHGNGQEATATMAHDAPRPACGDCHAVADVGDWGTMSGEHGRHLGQGFTCEECHQGVSADGATIAGPAMHVDGEETMGFPSGLVFEAGTCTGDCHGEAHSGRTW